MAYSTLTLADSILNLITKNDTDTSSYDVSKSLNQRVNYTAVGFHAKKPLRIDQYPAIFIEPGNRVEEFETASGSGNRTMAVPFNIVSITQYGAGQEDGRNLADREMIQLSDNLSYLLRANTRLSNTSYVMQSVIDGVEFGVEEYENTYNSISRISLQVRIKSS